MDTFERNKLVTDIADVINKHSLENLSNTPDIIIAEYLCRCLETYNLTILLRNDWYYNPDRVNTGVIDPMQPNSHQE